MRSNAAEPAETTPWYRQFWPWFLIAPPAVAVVGGLATLWLALSSPNPLVVDDYSRIARAIEKRLERDQAAAALGLRAEIRIVAAAGLVQVHLYPETVQPEALELRLSHPLIEERDRVLPLTRVPDGWSAELEPPEGRWYVQLYPGDRVWRLSGELTGSRSLVLVPPAYADPP
ncbi:FixH family protein [Thioalkalicoccus limnaeus]|uniref:FixH family protein n=1 Tax=Thioalkalicoccus limnaeus TaxID=120681 RepID=A0ABV4BI18_9GAMM